MKSSTTSAILSIAALSSCSMAAVTMNIVRNPALPKMRPRHLSPRAAITESLANNVTGGSYFATVSVGTPAQQLSLAIDTGSSDVWMLDSTADLCTDPSVQDYYGGGCDSSFDSAKSTSLKTIEVGGFDISYADGTGSAGNYISDTFSVGGATIKALQMGLAFNSTVPTGLMGVGYDTNEAPDANSQSETPTIYPNLIDQMVSQGIIPSKAYSLYLDDLEASTGSIIFGGLDSDKYQGELLQLPIVPDTYQNGSKVFAEFTVALTSFGVTGQAGNTTNLTTASYDQPVILDSGTTITYVPDRLAALLFQLVNAVDDTQNSGNVYIDCDYRTTSPKMTFNYGFGGSSGLEVKVPVSELVFDLTGLFSTEGYALPQLPFTNACGFGIQPAGQSPNILGDTFLRSAYVVYDLTNNVVALAQTNFNSTSSSVVDFQASATGIPNVSGVASSVAVTETASGALGLGGGHTSTVTGTHATTTSKTTGTGTGSASTTSSTSSSSKSAAVGTVPAFDFTSLMVLGVSAAFAVLGGSLFLA